MSVRENDSLILKLLCDGRLRVDAGLGIVTAPKSNTPLKPLGATTKKGYLRTSVQVDGKPRCFMVHRIVFISVYGVPWDSEMQVDHLDGDKTNNRIENLELVSGDENVSRAKRNGLCAHLGRRDGIRDEKGRFGEIHDAFPEVAHAR